MLSVELSSCCSCDVFRQHFAVKRVKCSAIVPPFCSNNQNNSTSSPGFPGQRFNNLQPGCTFDVILTSSAQYDKILSKFGQQQLVMVNYYSFKISLRFWLVEVTHLIHHNQLLLTKFKKNFVILNRWRENDVKSAAWLQVIEPLTEKTWGRGRVVLVVRTKWPNYRGTFYSFHGEILSKNITRTARRQLDGQHLLFGVYLQNRADFNLLNVQIKMHYWYELTSTEVSMF